MLVWWRWRSSHESWVGKVNRKLCPTRAASGLMAFSSQERAEISQVLIRLMHARSSYEVLECVYAAVAGQHGCALYGLSETGLGLFLLYGIGGYKRFVPDIIPKGSDIFRQIIKTSATNLAPLADQPSLFDDYPQSMFVPIFSDQQFIGAMVSIHNLPNSTMLRFILNQASNALALLLPNESIDNPALDTGEKPKDIPHPPITETSKLTARENEVLCLLAAGLASKEIADKLFISNATCRHHIENILAKLRVHSRVAAVSVWLTTTGNGNTASM